MEKEHERTGAPENGYTDDYLENMTSNLKLKDLPPEERQRTLADNAVLTSVQVIYYTLDDDKDGDTWLESWINLRGEREAAYNQTFGHFDDGSTFVLNLGPKSNVMRKADIPGSWLQVRIRPNGNDTWRFHCRCTLYFSDGFSATRDFGTVTLDQGSTQANFYL